MLTIINFLQGLILGAVVGGGTTLLLTPYSGKTFTEKSQDLFHEIIETWQQAREEARTQLRADFERRVRG